MVLHWIVGKDQWKNGSCAIAIITITFYYKLLQNWMELHEYTNIIWAQLHTASSSLASVNWSVGYRLHTLPPFVLSPWPPLCCVEKKIVFFYGVGNTPHGYILSFKKEREENYFKRWHSARITIGCLDLPVVSLYSTLFSTVNLQKFGWQGPDNIMIFGIVVYNIFWTFWNLRW